MTTKKDIESALMRGADTLRDTIDAANYKDYVLPVMFVKYLSDSYTDAVEELSKQYSGIRLERQKKYLPFMVAEGCSFYDLYQQRFADNIGQLMNAAMRQIEADNNQQLAGVLSAVDYNSENALGTREHKNAILRDLLEDFEPLDLRPSAIEVKEGQVPADVIGDAYEYMIGQFASMAGKKAGSFYTPAAVSEIMARIVDVQPGERVYDPTCGSGSLLIKAAKKQNSKEVSIYGQEVNGSSVAMAKMNMYIHEIRDAKIGWGDTLANPVFLDADGNLLLFDAIVANMPFSKDKWASVITKKFKPKKDQIPMMIEVLKSKIHCARVTEANLNYMGSITIDEDLLDAANMIAGEKVYIADNNNGERFETYIIKGERGSGKICLNGAAARKVQPDDIVIIMSYALMDFEEAKSFKPTVIFPDPVTNSVVK